MQTAPISEQNRAMVLAAEKTRQTILHLQAEIDRLEQFAAHCLELAGEPQADPETAAIAQQFAPVQEAA